MEIFLAINQTTGYMEMIFDNEPDALTWTESQTAKTGDVYSIECEDACQNFWAKSLACRYRSMSVVGVIIVVSRKEDYENYLRILYDYLGQ